ncbi:MAG: HAD family phosphatase [Candidatus Aenigmatarchaeota archaeon]
MRTGDVDDARAPGAKGREDNYTPAGSSNRSSSAEKPKTIRAVIFDIGGVMVGLKYGRLYKYVLYGANALHRAIMRKEDDADNYARLYVSTRKFNDGMLEIIGELKAAGYKLPVLSNATHENIHANRRFGTYDHFHPHPLILSADVGLDKPDRRIFELAARRIGLRPEQCVFVDDKKRNVDAARQVGFNAIVFKNAKQLRKDLKKHGVKIG